MYLCQAKWAKGARYSQNRSHRCCFCGVQRRWVASCCEHVVILKPPNNLKSEIKVPKHKKKNQLILFSACGFQLPFFWPPLSSSKWEGNVARSHRGASVPLRLEIGPLRCAQNNVTGCTVSLRQTGLLLENGAARPEENN